MHKFTYALNSAYPVPKRYVVTAKLLCEWYTDIESQVKSLLTECQWLNFTTDESDEKARRRISNFSYPKFLGQHRYPPRAFFLLCITILSPTANRRILC